MKITKSNLKQLIKEELDGMLDERSPFGHGRDHAGHHSYAKQNMLALCRMGWSISNAEALWVASRNGNLGPEEVSARAQQHAKEHGEDSVKQVWGLARFIGSRDQCEDVA
jgi:hypothetical protein